MPEDKEVIKKLIEEPDIESKEMSIIKDKHQYSIRIPKDFADTIISSVGDLSQFKFKFNLKIPPVKSKDKPTLSGELIYGI